MSEHVPEPQQSEPAQGDFKRALVNLALIAGGTVACTGGVVSYGLGVANHLEATAHFDQAESYRQDVVNLAGNGVDYEKVARAESAEGRDKAITAATEYTLGTVACISGLAAARAARRRAARR